MGLSAIESMRMELARITLAQAECITEEGFIKSECRYKYQTLVRKARAFRESIDWLEQMRDWKVAIKP